ncbi:hypothetical protein GCM10028801_35960 [Nocardioides maradonensis]
MTSTPWSRAPHADAVIEAATAMALFAATSPGLDARPTARRELLRLYVLSLVTQGTLPKQGATRFVSVGAQKAAAGVPVEHEHVFTRAHLATLIEANPNQRAIRWIMENLAVAATVTKAEHELLSRVPKHLTGWDRYAEAGVEVIDLTTGESVTSNPELPDWLIREGDGRTAVRLPSDALGRLLRHEGFGALTDPEVVDIEGAKDWPLRRAEAFDVIEAVSHYAGQGFPSREAAEDALFANAGGFGIRQWLRDLVLDMLQ